MKTMRVMEAKQCAICERTLLVGELPLRFAPDGMDEYVEVCALCQEIAARPRLGARGQPARPRRSPRPPATAAQPGEHLRRQAQAGRGDDRRRARPAAAVDRRPGAARGRGALQRERRGAHGRRASRASLGEPQASIVVLSGPNPEVVITLAWDISWYQYRVSPDASQPVRLAERGLEPGELEEKFTDWNAHFEPGTGVFPESRIRVDPL